MGHAKSRREEQGRLKKNTSERTERAALYGLLTALAMVLGFVESLIPIPFPVPGIRLGACQPGDSGRALPGGDPGNGGGDGAPHRSHGAFPLEIRTVWPMASQEAFLSLLVMGGSEKSGSGSRRWASASWEALPIMWDRSPLRLLSSVQQVSFTICRRSWPPAARPEPSSA